MNINTGQLVTLIAAGVATTLLVELVVKPWLASRNGGTATA
jgi:hypothetical protein